MYFINGVELSSSEYNELKRMCEADSVEDYNKSLGADNGYIDWTTQQVILTLRSKGLIEVAQSAAGTILYSVRYQGRDFVNDLSAVQKAEANSKILKRVGKVWGAAWGIGSAVAASLLIKVASNILGI